MTGLRSDCGLNTRRPVFCLSTGPPGDDNTGNARSRPPNDLLRTMIRTLSLVALALAVPALAGPPPPVTALAYHPGGKLLVAGRHGDAAGIDPANGEDAAHLSAQTPHGQRLAVASGEPARSGVVRLYAVEEKGAKFEPKGELTGPKDVQYTLDFAPDNKTLAVAGYDRVIRLWDTDTLKVIRELKDH